MTIILYYAYNLFIYENGGGSSLRGVNKVILLGNAARDTELRQTASGKPVANLRIATNHRVRTRDGEFIDHPQFHTVVCWDRLAETTATYVTRGKPVYVEGRLEYRSFTDKEGHERQVAEIIASAVEFLGLHRSEGALPDTDDAGAGVDLDDVPL